MLRTIGVRVRVWCTCLGSVAGSSTITLEFMQFTGEFRLGTLPNIAREEPSDLTLAPVPALTMSLNMPPIATLAVTVLQMPTGTLTATLQEP